MLTSSIQIDNPPPIDSLLWSIDRAVAAINTEQYDIAFFHLWKTSYMCKLLELQKERNG